MVRMGDLKIGMKLRATGIKKFKSDSWAFFLAKFPDRIAPVKKLEPQQRKNMVELGSWFFFLDELEYVDGRGTQLRLF